MVPGRIHTAVKGQYVVIRPVRLSLALQRVGVEREGHATRRIPALELGLAKRIVIVVDVEHFHARAVNGDGDVLDPVARRNVEMRNVVWVIEVVREVPCFFPGMR